MHFVKGKVKNEMYKGHEIVTVTFSVDDLMKGNTPHTNFWTFCLMNDLIRKRFPDLEYDPDDPDCDAYISTIDNVELIRSENKEKNKKVEEMFNKLNIFVDYYVD